MGSGYRVIIQTTFQQMASLLFICESPNPHCLGCVAINCSNNKFQLENRTCMFPLQNRDYIIYNNRLAICHTSFSDISVKTFITLFRFLITCSCMSLTRKIEIVSLHLSWKKYLNIPSRHALRCLKVIMYINYHLCL